MVHPWLKKYPKNISWSFQETPYPVYHILDQAVARFGNNYAMDFLGKKYTYHDIGEQTNRMAFSLAEQGIGLGKKVGLFLPNSPYFFIAYYAILKTGASVVHFNPLYAPQEVEQQIKDSETEIMITLDLKVTYDKLYPCLELETIPLKKIIVGRMADVLPFPKNMLFNFLKKQDKADIKWDDRHLSWRDLVKERREEAFPSPQLDLKNDVALLQYTGGTTGTPKGAMLTHENVYFNTLQSSMWFPKVESGKEKMLGVLPFFHVFAMTVVLNLSVYQGMEIITLPRFDMEETLRTIHKKKPTLFPAVPAIYSGIVHFKNLKKYDLSSIKFCISGGAPLPVDTKKLFEKVTGCHLAEGYGLTETSPVACCNPLEGENKAGSIGLPLPGTEVEIISPETKEAMPIGEPGEICIRGPQVMKGYYKKPEETKNVLNNGLLRTGDIAYMDEDGYCFIIDRIKDLIITNGYNVYPRVVEEAIYQYPDVEECIVAGLPDKNRGEIVKAWIKLKDGKSITVNEIKVFLKNKLSSYEMPRRFEFREEPLPKTLIGKLSRKDVIKQENNQS